MPKAVQIGLWFTVVGITLLAQGCWDEEQGELMLIGQGGCRLADGSEGDPVTVMVASAGECQAQCFANGRVCSAVEFNGSSNNCEIHHEPVTTFSAVVGVECYVLK